MSLTSTGGTLHGVWVSDNTISSSDRRLKKDISPLLTELLSVPDEQETDAASEPSAWLLRQLRPVSFVRTSQAKKEGKPRREYGFIAQELEKLLPDIVQPLQPGADQSLIGLDDLKGVAYIDLIALLTAFAQQEMLRRERTDDTVGLLRRKVTELEEMVDQLRAQTQTQFEERVTQFEERVTGRVEKLTEQLGLANRTIAILKDELDALRAAQLAVQPVEPPDPRADGLSVGSHDRQAASQTALMT
jgi:hypothetical protein